MPLKNGRLGRLGLGYGYEKWLNDDDDDAGAGAAGGGGGGRGGGSVRRRIRTEQSCNIIYIYIHSLW